MISPGAHNILRGRGGEITINASKIIVGVNSLISASSDYSNPFSVHDTGSGDGGIILLNGTLINITGKILAIGGSADNDSCYSPYYGKRGKGGIVKITSQIADINIINVSRGPIGWCNDSIGGVVVINSTQYLEVNTISALGNDSGGNVTLRGHDVIVLGSIDATTGIPNGTIILEYNNTLNISLATITPGPYIIKENEFGRIEFTERLNKSKLDINSSINITLNSISVDASTTFDNSLNMSAKLTIKGLSYTSVRILKDSANCDSSVCENVIYDNINGILTFNVTSWSDYSASENNTDNFTFLVDESGTVTFYNVSSGTFNNTFYNSTIKAVQLKPDFNNGTYISKVFDAGSDKSWLNISWKEGAPYGREIGRADGRDSSTPNFGGVNTSGLVLLMHFNNESAFGEATGEAGLNNKTFDFSVSLNPEKTNFTNGSFYHGATINKSEFKFGGGSAQFDGVDDYIDFGKMTDLEQVANFTFHAWIKTNTLSGGGSNLRYITGMEGAIALITTFILRLDTSTDTIEFLVPATSFGTPVESNKITQDAWYSIGAVYDGNQYRLYINGKSQGTPQSRTGNTNPSTENLKVGGGHYTNDRMWSGQIDEVSVWNRSLSANEIRNLYLRGAARLNISVRSCDDASCDTETYDLTAANSTKSDISSLTNNRYLQYRANFYTESNNSLSPELHNVTIHYEDAPVVVEPTICDGGDLDTTCWINRTHYINSSFTVLSGNNLIINASGAILNHTALNFFINMSGNITIQEGGVIGLNGTSCSSGTCISGGNLTIVAQKVNVSGTITVDGGATTGDSANHYSGNGGIIIINASEIYISRDSIMSASSDDVRDSGSNHNGGYGGTIKLNATLVNITGTIKAVGGHAVSNQCGASGYRGDGGLVNITAMTIENTGLINVEKGKIGYCEGNSFDNDARDGQIFINNKFSPCNNGTIIDMDFSKTCKISKGIRIPNDYVLNLSGKNYTLSDGARLNGDGHSCNNGICQSGNNFTIVVDVLNLSNGNISSDGGGAFGNAGGHTSGSGGVITINASKIFIEENSKISASSDRVTISGATYLGGNAGIINLNSTIINISGELITVGGNAEFKACSPSSGQRGDGGLVNITVITIENTGTINVQKGWSGGCDKPSYQNNQGRDGQIFINNKFSPCNNGTILDSDFSKSCKITKGIRIPNDYVLNLSGKNYTLYGGARLNADGEGCSSGICQAGENFTIIIDVLNLTGGNISSDGGGTFSSTNNVSGSGGIITINASKIFIGENSMISASSDDVKDSANQFIGGKGGTVRLNASLINISGTIKAIGGNADTNECNIFGHRGDGGTIIITSQIADINIINVSRGGIGFCDDGKGGIVIINATQFLKVTTISALGNDSGGNVTLSGHDVTVLGSIDATTGIPNGTIILEYNNTINISLATITPGPYLIKENEFGRIEFAGRLNKSKLDINSSINITSNSISVDGDGFSQSLNMSAKLRITGVSVKEIKILREGVTCDSNICEAIVYDSSSGVVTFNVTGWTKYSAGEGAVAMDSICDGGDLSTTCWINRTHYINSSFTVLSGNNLIINGSGAILNHTALNFFINMTGNITIEEGGVIGLNGSSCSSGTCISGGNLTIVAQKVNVSGTVTVDGGATTGSIQGHISGDGGIITINSTIIYVGTNSMISASSDVLDSTLGFSGGDGGKINLNATIINNTGTIKAVGGNGDSNSCTYGWWGEKGSGGTINITATTFKNIGLINVERGSIGQCSNNGRDGMIFVNNKLSPCNNGTILDSDFSKTCKITKGIRVPNGHVLNLSGKNYTLYDGARLNGDGEDCWIGDPGDVCQSGDNFTLIVNVLNLSNGGNISSDGGKTTKVSSGDGGIITINASEIYVDSNSEISASSDYLSDPLILDDGGDGGIININATIVNITGAIKVLGGYGDDSSCSGTGWGHRGDGGTVTITSQIVDINIINASRGGIGWCNDGKGGIVIINASSYLEVNSIYALGNGTVDADDGNVTLRGHDILVSNQINASSGSYDGKVILEYNNTINISLATITPGPYIIKENEFGRIEFTDRLNQSLLDINSSINITSNSLSVDASKTFDDSLNMSAKLTIKGLSYTSVRILKDSANCDSSVCENIIYDSSSGVVNFNVTGWTKYSADESAASMESICDGGDLSTTCWINRTHYINSSFTVLSGNNLIINGSGAILNHTSLNFFINMSGNITIEEGGVIGLNGSSCSSGTCISGGNLTIVADVVNVSGLIRADGGTTRTGGFPTSGQGGVININASTIYVGVNGEISASSDYYKDSSAISIGGIGGIIRINASIINNTGKILALGGNGDNDDCLNTMGLVGDGGLINITALSIENTGLINVEKGTIGYCDGIEINNQGRDGFIFINNKLSPCNNGTILDSDFSKSCVLTEGIRVPNDYVLNLSGKNYTISSGGRLNADGEYCRNFGVTCQAGENFTLIVDVLNLSNGSISSDGGGTLLSNIARAGRGGVITINASKIYIDSNSKISASSDDTRKSTSSYYGEAGGTIKLNATLINNSGTIKAVGGNADGDTCTDAYKSKGSGGVINITTIDIENNGLINVEKGPYSYCDGISVNNEGRDGLIFINNKLSPCNNGTILDLDFSKSCKISKGIRVPNNYILNLSGKNYTIGPGGRLNADGEACNTGKCQSGENFTIIVDVLNLTGGNISSDGGAVDGGSGTDFAGRGGIININASKIYGSVNSEISASSDYVQNGINTITGETGGTININATLINFSGKIKALGGNGRNDACSGNQGLRGDGGTVTITSSIVDVNIINVSRGLIGYCNDGKGGIVIINATSSLFVNSIYALGNGTVDAEDGNVTLRGHDILVTNQINASSGSFDGTVILEYNNTLNISLATITPGPYLIKENEFGRIEFADRLNRTDFDINSSINITSNSISVDASTTFDNSLNMSAKLTIKGLSFVKANITKDGVTCPSDICEEVVYNSGTGILTFNVTGWTEYKGFEEESNPTLKYINLTPLIAYTNTTLSCEFNITDTTDTALIVNVSWFRDGLGILNQTNIDYAVDSIYYSNLSFNYSYHNDVVYCNVTFNDTSNVLSNRSANVVIQNYSTSLVVENGTASPIAGEDVYFYANYSSDLMPVTGVGLNNYEIGSTIWNTSESLGQSWSARFYDCEKKGKKDCAIFAKQYAIDIYYSNGSLYKILSNTDYTVRGLIVTDIDNDGYESEFIAGGIDFIVVYNRTGGIIWGGDKDYGTIYSIALGNLDNDTYANDIIIGNDTDVTVFLNYSYNGKINWTKHWDTGTNFSLSMSTNRIYEIDIGDIDRDGYEDDIVVVDYTGGHVLAFDGFNASLFFNTTYLGKIYSVEVLDLDHDGYRDEVVAGGTGVFYAFEWNGSYNAHYLNQESDYIWKNSDPVGGIYEIITMDIDEDGWEDDIVIGDIGTWNAGPGKVWALDNDSNELWSYTLPNAGSHDYIYSIIAKDVDDKQNKEILFTSQQLDKLYVLNKSGNLLAEYSVPVSDSVGSIGMKNPSLDISDINNDGIGDIISAPLNTGTADFGYVLQHVTCELIFDDSSRYNMTWNQTLRKWQANRTFDSAQSYDWNVTCEKGGYETQLSASVLDVSDGTPPIINGTLNISTSLVIQGDIINATYNATDETALDNGTIIINDTGFNRYFNFSLTGTEAQFSQNFTISCGAGCVVNITGRVNDTSGNIAQNETIFTVQPTPDLNLVSMTVPNIFSNETLIATINVSNDGTNFTVSNVSCYFDDTLFDSYIVKLNPDAYNYSNCTKTITNEGGTNHSIRVNVDPDNTIIEISESNNENSTSINITQLTALNSTINKNSFISGQTAYFYANYTRDNDNSSVPANYSFLWSASPSLFALESVAVLDLDHDNKTDEIIVGDTTEDIHALQENGTKIWTHLDSGSFSVYEIVVGDFDNDTFDDDIAYMAGSDLLFINESGDIIGSAPQGPFFSLDVYDLNNDGFDEVIAGTSGDIYAYYPNGTQMWANSLPESTIHEIIIGDLESDGDIEIIAVDNAGYIWVYNASGNLTWNSSDKGSSTSTAAIGDLNNDNKNDVVFGATNIKHAYHGNGTEFSASEFDTNNFGEYIFYESIIMDIDGDGDNEILMGTDDKLTLFNRTGGNEWEYPVSSDLGDFYSIAVDDIDNDGKNEIIGGDTGTDTLYILNASGNLRWSVPASNIGNSLGYGSHAAITTADINNDGQKDIIYAETNYLRVLEHYKPCKIWFNDTKVWKAMSYNETSSQYQYNRTLSNTGNYTYNISCSKTLADPDFFVFEVEKYNSSFFVIPDTTVPIINGTINKTIADIKSDDTLNATFNVTDDYLLDTGQVIINDTGFKRYFNFSLSGTTAQFSQNFTISCSPGCVINVTGRVTDTGGNARQNETIFTIPVSEPVITANYTIPLYPKKDENVTFYAAVYDVDGSINSVNFTIIAPGGVKVKNNVNGSNNGQDNNWNTTYNLSSYGTWLWNISVYNSYGFIINSSTGTIILMELTESLNDTDAEAYSQDHIAVYGHINLSNGTNVSDRSISIYVNNSLANVVSPTKNYNLTYRCKILINETLGVERIEQPLRLSFSELNNTCTNLFKGIENSTNVYDTNLNPIKFEYKDNDADDFIDADDEIIILINVSANTTKNYWIYYADNFTGDSSGIFVKNDTVLRNANETETNTDPVITSLGPSALAADLAAISSPDNSRWTTAEADTDQEKDYQSFQFNISSPSSVKNITYIWEGYGTNYGATFDTFLKIYNYTKGDWELLKQYQSNGADITHYFNITGNISDLVNSDGIMTVSAAAEYEKPKSSCPFLYLWNGTDYEFITDIKGQNIGFPSLHPRAKKVKYFIAQEVPLKGFKPEKGIYKLKLRETITESDYVDELKLLLVDHPEGYEVISSTTNDILTFEKRTPESVYYTIKDPRLPLSAVDSYGADVLENISYVDNNGLYDLSDPYYYIDMDFGEINPMHAKLVIDAWTVFQFPRKKHRPVQPFVEVINESGEWNKVEKFGWVAGDFKTMVVDLSDKFKTDDHRIRVHLGYFSTAVSVFDRIRLDDSEPVDLEIHKVELSYAELYYAGKADYIYTSTEARITSTDSKLPDSEASYFYGNFTKYGNVKELLKEQDDMFVIMRHGDAMELRFMDVSKPREGYERTPVLLADVYYKIVYNDKANLYGGDQGSKSIYPLPFHNMSQYEYNVSEEQYPDDELHKEYLDKWNTRVCDEDKDYCYDSKTGRIISEGNEKPKNAQKRNNKQPHNSLFTDFVNITVNRYELNYTVVLEESITMTDSYGNYNYTFTAPSGAGTYPVKVNATWTDTIPGENTVSLVVTPDTEKPSITLNKPANNSNQKSSIVFNFTAADNSGVDMDCNLTIDGIVNVSSITASHNTPKTQSVSGFNDGNYTWNVTCLDESNNVNTSVTWRFSADGTAPVINLTNPANNSFAGANVIFNFTTSDSSGLYNCSLHHNISGTFQFNKSINLTGTSSNSNLSIQNIPDGTLFIWNVECYDDVSIPNKGFADNNYTLKIDSVFPAVRLDSPSNNTWNGSGYSVTFMYTPNDINLESCVLYYNYSSVWKANLTNSSPANNQQNNLTVALNDSVSTLFRWDVQCSDSAGNSAFNGSNFTLRIDAGSPQLYFTGATKPHYANASQNYIYINVSINEPNLNNMTFYLYNNSLDLINETNYTSLVNTINFTSLNEGSYFYNVTVRDVLSRINSTETRNITLDFTAPNVSLNLPTPANNTVGPEEVAFNWTASDNMDLSLTCYPTVDGTLQTALKTTNGSYSNTTVTLTGGNHSISVTCFDDANNSNTTEERTYIAAIVNITAPVQNQIMRSNENFVFNIDVLAGSDWINNITLIIHNESFETQNISNILYRYTYTAANIDPQFINATAYGFRNSIGQGMNVTSQIQLIMLRPAGSTLAPSLIYACPNESYTLNGSNVTIETIVDLDTLLQSHNVTITLPNQQTQNPPQLINTSESNLVYKFNYTFLTSVEGVYTIAGFTKDYENQTISFNRTLTVSNSTISINITKINIESLAFKDTCSGKTLQDGNSFVIPNNSYYDANAVITSALSLDIWNLSLSENVNNTINYTLGSNQTDPPSNKRRIYMWDLSTNMGYSNITLYYNYSSIKYSLSYEDDLALYKCSNIIDCTLEEQDIVLNTTTSMITYAGDLSRFMVVEPSVSNYYQQNIVTSSGVGGGGGGGSMLPYGLELIVPGPVSMYSNDTIKLPIILRNKGRVQLKGINLSAESPSKDLDISLTKNRVEKLGFNESTKTELIIISHTDPGRYEITITADVENPPFSDTAKVYIDLVKKGKENNAVVVTRVVFARDLFKENPECLELQELLDQAETALEEEKYAKAKSLTESAINGCKDLITSLSKELKMPHKESPALFGIPYKMLAIIGIAMIIAFIVAAIILRPKGTKQRIIKKKVVTAKRAKPGLFSFLGQKKEKRKAKTPKKAKTVATGEDIETMLKRGP